MSRFSEVLGVAQETTQQSEHLESEPFGYPNIQPSEQLPIQQPKQSTIQPSEKIVKRENPDYTQTTFRIPKKLSRQINRVLMDLADEGVEMDRSDLLQELATSFIRLADEKGAIEALKRFKKLGIQMDK